MLMNNRIQAMFELPTQIRSNVDSFGELVDQATKHYRALQALNVPFLEAFLIYTIVSKLDEDTQLKWRERLNGNALPSMEDGMVAKSEEYWPISLLEPIELPETRSSIALPSRVVPWNITYLNDSRHIISLSEYSPMSCVSDLIVRLRKPTKEHYPYLNFRGQNVTSFKLYSE
ncbi:hypothetical protein WN55_07617 [Dufourea novaeangliae]|uniref:Uncharacterized protein n=1 Tax=Dufourea novaeangliae TaxID=178035 RepID=A0A154PSJ9_DUFNO|nr:hypothetical protein WN55_07617 [Dufourea novaeangliae]